MLFWLQSICLWIIVAYSFVCARELQHTEYPSFEYRNRSFILDGKPFRFIGGSIHYFRIHPMLWEDRLKRVRSLGINVVQFYIPWNYHETKKGRYNFVGSRDVVRFIKIAAKNDLKILLRLGPYVCGEWENGGLPWWLLLDKDIKMRTADPRYTSEVKRWFDKLLPILLPYLHRNGGPILMVQIENEYGSFNECDHGYIRFLRDLVRMHFGSSVLQYTTDGPDGNLLLCGSVNGTLATVDFGPVNNETVDRYFAVQRRFASNAPLVNSEYYAGWFTLWGQEKQILPDNSEVINTLSYMYDIGASFSFYMIHGGTNFGFWNGAENVGPVTTSYDYGAPIREHGDVTLLYVAIRNWISSLKGWPWPPRSLPPPIPKIGIKGVRLYYVGSFDKYLHKAKCGRRCVFSKYPLSFEEIGHPFGYVIYSTSLKFSGTNLTIPLLKDFGFVFINGKYQGTLTNRFKNITKRWISLRNVTPRSTLTIVVENQGRQTYETIKDYKGVLSNVTLDAKILQDWTICGVNLKHMYTWVSKSFNNGNIAEFKKRTWDHYNRGKVRPGIFFGSFDVPYAADTFFDATGWGKGIIMVNGVNLGRYWPSVGPQVTLYVPAPVLEYKNYVLLVELQKSGRGCRRTRCYIRFINHPISRFLS